LAAAVTQPVQNFSPGMPVEVGQIDRKLGELWSTSDAGKVRASLVNLVVYSESPDAIAANTPLLAEIAADHAFRALLVQADPQADKTDVEAWITAHCHRRESGGPKEICSEQITFRLEGSAAERLPNIVFSHLDSDLPLCFWWQGELHPEPDARLWTRVDRLIVDSQSWSQPAPQFAILRDVEALGAGRCAVCDLNWTRLFHLRYAIAQIFDTPAARAKLPRLEKVEIRYLTGHRLTALQLLGWIASRLGWHLEHDGERYFFRRRDGGEAAFVLREEAELSAAVASAEFHFPGAEASAKRADDGEFYFVEYKPANGSSVSQMLPAGREKISDILLAELARVGRHPLFWPAIRAVEPLL
jgi:glucose-6-phosphate dehydrogenase assembly protein OpcA